MIVFWKFNFKNEPHRFTNVREIRKWHKTPDVQSPSHSLLFSNKSNLSCKSIFRKHKTTGNHKFTLVIFNLWSWCIFDVVWIYAFIACVYMGIILDAMSFSTNMLSFYSIVQTTCHISSVCYSRRPSLLYTVLNRWCHDIAEILL